jgi:recombination associated protein RdgC
MLKQLQFFALPESWEPPADLEAALDPHRIQPILACESIRTGFEPLPAVDTLTHSGMGATLFAVATDRKRVPAQVVKREVDRRIGIVKRDGGKLSKGERNQIKDDTLADLLARAFAVRSTVLAYFDTTLSMLVIGTASESAAERVILTLRHALGSMPVEAVSSMPLGAEEVLKSIAKRGECGEFRAGASVDFADAAEGGTAKLRRFDIPGPESAAIIEDGSDVAAIELTYDDRMTLVIDSTCRITRLRLPELEESATPGDARDDFAGRFALLVLEVRELVKGLRAAGLMS